MAPLSYSIHSSGCLLSALSALLDEGWLQVESAWMQHLAWLKEHWAPSRQELGLEYRNCAFVACILRLLTTAEDPSSDGEENQGALQMSC